MLIDASHPEETRVVVQRGNRVEEFDFESASKKPLRGNIYLAKVTRVEPSLQAAFIDYGGNRHGFLAFSEIHPDYYQIPVADRQALLEDVAAEIEDEEEEERRPRRSRRRRGRDDRAKRQRNDDATISEDAPAEDASVAATDHGEEARLEAPTPGADAQSPDLTAQDSQALDSQAHATPETLAVDAEGYATIEARDDAPVEPPMFDHEAKAQAREDREQERREAETIDSTSSEESAESEAAESESAESDITLSETAGAPHDSAASEAQDDDEDEDDEEEDEEDQVEQVGGDALEEVPRRQPRMRRQYKIQEVIKRRQVLLVQVVKEERGNKGAALTTYLSLAGRYSVLMPNTARGGGISRKITDNVDRKRLKEIAQDLEVPEGMGVILRTAGASRTRQEVRRDFEYLIRMWETVRETTLRSSAPMLVYEEGSLIKRAIRDLYNKDVDEVIVAGDEGYREAKEFMRLLMPSHAKNVRPWREQEALFVRSGVESQLDAMFSNHVTLKSGGYLVINQTEALVAIDVNSGRSTREHNIEDTALRTNLEAADEVARQLRLRDLAGLIVVDFIDMEEPRNNRSVERRMKDALKNDRARIQVGRISHFGLLEMSRQRIRTGVLEGSTVPCPHCAGSGMVRSVSSIALHVLRVLEESLIKSASHNIIVKTRTHVALYILNQKRAHLRGIEERYGVDVFVVADDSLTGSTYHALERGEAATGRPAPRRDIAPVVDAFEDEVEEIEDEIETEGDEDGAEAEERDAPAREGAEETEAEAQRRKRRRRRRRGGRDRDNNERDNNERENGERESLAHDAPQPSDDGLAVVAEATGEIIPRVAHQWREPGEGFWARENSDAAEPFRAPAAILTPAAPRGAIVAPAAEVATQAAPVVEAPVVETTVAVAPVAQAPVVAEAPAVVAETPAAPVETASVEPAAPREPTERVITAADPHAPKKGGWWQRAKATLGG